METRAAKRKRESEEKNFQTKIKCMNVKVVLNSMDVERIMNRQKFGHNQRQIPKSNQVKIINKLYNGSRML